MAATLESLVALVEHQHHLTTEVTNLELMLKMKKEELRQVTEDDIPEAMDALGLEELKLSDGRKIYVEEQIHASIPKARELEAYRWLRDNGHDSIVKRELGFRFARGEAEIADKIHNLVEEVFGISMDNKDSVHHSTLKKFVSEMLESGHDLPTDLFGVYQRRVAKATDAR